MEFTQFGPDYDELLAGHVLLDEKLEPIYEDAVGSGDLERLPEIFERNKTTIDACINNADSLWHIR